jgi:hypothetical protein
LNNQIIHFGQDLDREEFYNLIVKVTDIGSSELSAEIRNELPSREFTIYYSDDDTIEANFKNRYMELANKLSELEKVGWIFGSND